MASILPVKAMTPESITALQEDLNSLGYRVTVDGRYGPETAAAYQDYLDGHPAPPPAKAWWTSRRIVGSLATILLGFAGLFGLSLGPDDAQLIETVITSIATAVAGAVSLYGSIKGTRPIDPNLVLPGIQLVDGRLRKLQD